MFVLNSLKDDLEAANNELKLILSQKLKELIAEKNDLFKEVIEKAYLELEDEKKQKIVKISKKIKQLGSSLEIQSDKDSHSNIDAFDKKNPNRKLLEVIIKEIKIFSDRTLEFQLMINIDELCKDDN